MRKKKSIKEEEEEKKGFEHELMKEEAHQLEMQDSYESDEKYEESED